jgi:hypothetical protein
MADQTTPQTPATDLAHESRRLHAEAMAAQHRSCDAMAAFRAMLTPEQDAAYLALDDDPYDHRKLWRDFELTELRRHFPGLAPALLAVRDHIVGQWPDEVGRCCTPAEV